MAAITIIRLTELLLFTVAVLLGWQVRKLRKEGTTMPQKCPGQLNSACTCDGSCQLNSSSPVIGCTCPACVKTVSTLAPPAAPHAPRGSGSGMTGFAGAGERDFGFAVGSVTGLRQWTLDKPDFRGNPLRGEQDWRPDQLVGMTGYTWPPGVVEAVCNNGHRHVPPVEVLDNGTRDGCGFWAYWDAAGLAANRSSPGRGLPVLGVIEGFGRVLLGEKGFRSQKARIVALAPAFTIQAEVSPPMPGTPDWNTWTDYPSPGTGPLPAATASQAAYEDVQRQAQQHADAWMAVIQARLGEMYPGAAVFATAAGLLASVKTEGRPE
jgi:hypothetical protein